MRIGFYGASDDLLCSTIDGSADELSADEYQGWVVEFDDTRFGVCADYGRRNECWELSLVMLAEGDRFIVPVEFEAGLESPFYSPRMWIEVPDDAAVHGWVKP